MRKYSQNIESVLKFVGALVLNNIAQTEQAIYFSVNIHYS